jgi:hypothetical protein
MNRLLIIACSQRKKPDNGLLPAIERYDGPAFRVLRKYLAETLADAPSVVILSARFGLIDASTGIVDYDHRMSAGRARELSERILKAGQPFLAGRREVAVCVGKDYRPALADLLGAVPEGTAIGFIEGGQGTRLTRLRAWLRRAQDDTGRDGKGASCGDQAEADRDS